MSSQKPGSSQPGLVPEETTDREQERLARMGLCSLLPMGNPGLARLIAEHGPVAVWEALLKDGEDTAWRRKARVVDLPLLLAQTHACQARFVIPGDEEWPAGLDELDQVEVNHMGGAPLGLWVRGHRRLEELTAAVAMVGARASSPYGEEIATEWSLDLAALGRPVVSGLAYGIDGAAHRGALLAGGFTAAFVAGGVDRAYPISHTALMDEVLARGLVASEAPPGTSPQKAAFLSRNRLIAAVTEGVVVVEAAPRSGARNTASWAAALGRVVMAVPGPVTSSLSATPHHLVREGIATLVTGPAQIVDLLGGLDATAERAFHGEPVPLDRLTEPQRQVRECVNSGEEVDVGTLMGRTGLSIPEAWAAADELVDLGWLEEVIPGSWRLPRRR